MTNERYRTIKVRQSTYRRLKLLAAEQDMTLVDLIDQVVKKFSVTDSDTNTKDAHETGSCESSGAALGSAEHEDMRA